MYRVFLVDDEPILKIAFRKMLDCDACGFQIAGTASNGAEALKFIAQNQVDLVITDLKMPVMDGIELIKALKTAAFPGGILVLSNYTDFELVRQALTEGATDYLLKVNISRELLLQQLNKMADQFQSAKQNQAESARRDLLLEEQQKAMRTALMKEYFSDPAVGDGELAEHMDSPLREIHLPFHVLLLRFQETAPDVKKWGIILSRIADILQEIFEGSDSIIVLRLHHDELLCLVAADAFPNNGGVQGKLRQIIRQISMYFSVSPSIFYSEPVTDVAQAKKKYELCRDAANLLFYTDADIVSAESIRFSTPANEQDSTSLMNTISHAFHAGDLESLRLESHRYLCYCKNALILPQKVKDVFSHILDYVNFVNTFPEPPADLSPEQQWLRESKGAQELENALLLGFENLNKRVTAATSKYKKEVRDIILYINSHYTEKMNLDMIASSVNLNRSYLCRLFKQDAGCSIFTYINKIRMEKAAELIVSKDRGIFVKEVASCVGIDDPFYFTRRFKEYYGVNPSEYKGNG